MVGALGVDQAKLFTSVFFVGSVLAGLGGALQIPREPANLDLDLAVIADAFVVTVVGGLGSIGGAFLAAILIGVAKAFCIGIGTVHWFGEEIVFSKLTLVVEFLIMALVLVVRPFGLLGKPQAVQRARGRSGAAAHRAVLDLRAGLAGAAAGRAAAGRPLRHHPADRHLLLRPVRRQPALHHGPGRHGVVRPCRLFRPGRLCRRPVAEARRPADGSGARAGAARRRRLRRGLWLVLRAPVAASISPC